MVVLKHEITIDVDAPDWSSRLYLVQGTDNEITLHIQKGGEPYDLTDIGTAVLVSQPTRRGSMPAISTATITDAANGVAVVKVLRRAFEYPGIVKSQLKLYGSENSGQLSSTAFEIEVEKSTDKDYQPAEDEMSFIEQNMVNVEVATVTAEDAAVSAIDARDRLTGEVGAAIRTLNEDKAEALGEVEVAVDEVNEVAANNKTLYRGVFATEAERDAAIPSPTHGITVTIANETTGLSTTTRYVDAAVDTTATASGWVAVDRVNNPLAINQLNQQLADTSAKSSYGILNKANALNPLYIETYDGGNQSTHPKVLAFDKSWKGYKYWMAYTPYPDSKDVFENPSIATSSDGLNWVTPTGFNNPLASLTSEEESIGGHYSDTHLVYRSDLDRLECWYRYSVNGVSEKIMRRTTTDGKNWSAQELMINVVPLSLYLSPAILFEDNKYKMWYVDGTGKVYYRESADGFTWSNPTQNAITLENNYVPWHLDVVHTDLGYEMLLSVKTTSNANDNILLCGLSQDGLNWDKFKLSIGFSSDKNAFDSREIYRSSFIKEGGIYKVYYSAMSVRGKWNIGLSMGKSLDTLIGGTYSTVETIDGDMNIKRNLYLKSGNEVRVGGAKYGSKSLKLLDPGVSGAQLAISTSPNGMEILNDSGTGAGDLGLRNITIKKGDGTRYGAIKQSPTLNNALEITGSTDSIYAFLKVVGLQFAGVTGASNPDTGMVRWFANEEKLKMYFKSRDSWYSLNPLFKGTTANRPTTNLEYGMTYFDSTLNKPIWRNANNDGWVDAMGNPV